MGCFTETKVNTCRAATVFRGMYPTKPCCEHLNRYCHSLVSAGRSYGASHETLGIDLPI